MPSVKEGWGLVVVEAAAHGTPTVAFRSAGGPRESVRHRETGVLAEDEAGFVDAVRPLLADDALRAGMGRAARAHAASFSWTAARPPSRRRSGPRPGCRRGCRPAAAGAGAGGAGPPAVLVRRRPAVSSGRR